MICWDISLGLSYYSHGWWLVQACLYNGVNCFQTVIGYRSIYFKPRYEEAPEAWVQIRVPASCPPAIAWKLRRNRGKQTRYETRNRGVAAARAQVEWRLIVHGWPRPDGAGRLHVFCYSWNPPDWLGGWRTFARAYDGIHDWFANWWCSLPLYFCGGGWLEA